MQNPTVKYAIAAALVVIVMGLQFAGVFADDEGTQATPTASEPTPSVTVDPVTPGGGETAPTGTSDPADATDDDPIPGFDENVAVMAASARSTWSWEDREPSSWAERLASLSTDHFADQLEELPTTAVDEAEWAHGVVEPQAASRVVDVRVKLLDGSARSGSVDAVVRYDVEVSYAKPELIETHGGHGEPDPAQPVAVPEAGEWVPLMSQKLNMRFVYEDGRWLVDALAYPAS